MAKRKRELVDAAGTGKEVKNRKADVTSAQPSAAVKGEETASNGTTGANKSNAPAQTCSVYANPYPENITVQVITGSYERVLHGFAASMPHVLVTGQDTSSTATPRTKSTTKLVAKEDDDTPKTDFSDTFLFNAHASAIRCLALSPTPTSTESSKILLATGSTDERINLYSLSTSPPSRHSAKILPKLPSLHGSSINENSKNKELGSLLHHSSNITALYFPTRSKLLSAAEDSTIAITRTRDWTALSTIKAPIPKPQGRPSGDTAGPGEVPSGINDFAVHPSMKLMVSVGKGEKCMRLWNLVTGKKAGVLNFGRNILAAVSEGRFGSGEGRKVVWGKEGEEFAVAFERGVVVFGVDSEPKGRVVPLPRTKVHEVRYLPQEAKTDALLVSTEDGRVLVYNSSATVSDETVNITEKDHDIPHCRLIAQIGGPAAGITGRIKDFGILLLPKMYANDESFLVITGSSDGGVRIWLMRSVELQQVSEPKEKEEGKGFIAKQVGRLLGTYSTGTRITCLKAFIMTGKSDEEEEDIVEGKEDESSGSDEESE